MWLGVAYFRAGSSKVSPSLHAALKKKRKPLWLALIVPLKLGPRDSSPIDIQNDSK